MKRTILMTIMALSLIIGLSNASMPAQANMAEQHHRPAPWMQVGGDGVTDTKAAEQQKPVQVTLPGHADREKPPVLMAPGCDKCIKNPAYSTWQQFHWVVSVFFAI